jgi:uncharacterized membrane protein YesL
MNRFFDPDNLFFSTLSRLVDIVGLSLFWAMLCIPIVTIGPATAALYYTVVKSFREGDPKTFRLFFTAFWADLKQGVLCTLPFIPIALLIYFLGHVYSLAAEQGEFGFAAYSYFIVLALVPLALACWLSALLGRFDNPTRALFSTAPRLTIAHLPTTVLLVAIVLVCVYFTLRCPILIFVLPTCGTLLASFPLERAFRKHLPQEETAE